MKIGLWWGITCLRWCLSPLSVIIIKYIKIYEALLHSQMCWEARKLVRKLTQGCLGFWAFPSVTSFFQMVSFSCLCCQALFFNHLFFPQLSLCTTGPFSDELKLLLWDYQSYRAWWSVMTGELQHCTVLLGQQLSVREAGERARCPLTIFVCVLGELL